MEHAFQFSGETHEVWLSRSRRGHNLHLGTRRIPITLIEQGENHLDFIVKDQLTRVYFAIRGDEVYVHHEGESFMLRYLHGLDRFASQKDLHSEAVARAPMPGAVISIAVQTDQEVHRGDQMVVIESMKMETAICAAIDGVVQEVHVQLGETFERGALIVTLCASKVAA